MIETRCPCGCNLTFPDKLIGKASLCTTCGRWLLIQPGLCLQTNRPKEYEPTGWDEQEAAVVPQSFPFHPGVAAVLSLVIPGAGQIYRGSLAAGFACLVAVAFCYVLGLMLDSLVPILLGLALHVYCVVDAASVKNKESRR